MEWEVRHIGIIWLLNFMSCFSYAQYGNIQGAIIDPDGIPVSGATIFMSGAGKGTVSDLNGRFTLLNVPAGKFEVQVRYLGYSDYQEQVGIPNDQTIFLTVMLVPKSILLKGVEVVSRGSASHAKALNTQKNAINISNIVSTDQIGKFPDANIGDALKRISGIAVQLDQGEARDLIIRGLSPELNSVTLNGSRIPSAEGDNRNIQLDLIPADMIQTIEVIKTLTPDMDADALGGSVNLVTRTSPQGFRVSATLGSGINFISDKRILNGSFLYGDRTDDDKFGWMLSASINDNDFGSDTVEATWSDSFSYNTGNTDASGEPIIEQVSVDPYPAILEIQPFWIQRVRRSFAANFDYQLNASNSLYLKTIYNWRDDRENRYVFEQEVLEGSEIADGDFSLTGRDLVRFPVLVSRQTRGGIATDRGKNARLEDQRMQNYTLGGNHLWGTLRIDWLTAVSATFEDIAHERTAEYKAIYGIIRKTGNPRYPLFVPENPILSGDLTGFEYDEIIEESNYTREEDINFFLNVTLPWNVIETADGQLKFGSRGRMKSKVRENGFNRFDLEESFPTLAETPNRDYTDPGFLAGPQYRAGIFPDERWLGDLDLRNGEVIPGEFLKQNYQVDEDVFAAYAMTRQQFGIALNVLAGIRVENTLFNALANSIEENSGLVGQEMATESYNNFLPSFHIRYGLSANTVLRFAWTSALSRPNYVDMVPTREIVYSDREISVGNPGLNPATSTNFDLMAEHYYSSVGILSLGVFSKNIKNFMYTFRSVTTDDQYGPGTSGFTLFQPLNGEEAALYGVELNYQRQLDFLPGFARHLSFDFNYTFLNSVTEGIRDVQGIDRVDLNLPDTPPHLFNASLGYEVKDFTARLSANFSGAYLKEVGGRSLEDIFYDRQLLLDFNASFNIHKNLSLYAGVNNLTNQPLRLYQGIHRRTSRIGFYDRRFTVGLKYDIFKAADAKR